MANENKEIGDIVKKCKILLLDIEGTTTSISFVKDKLFPYAEENVKQFLESQWESDDVKEVVTALRKLALEDQEKSVEGHVAIPGEDASKEDQIEGLVNNVKWQMSADRKVGPLKQLQGMIWKQGYDKGDIKGHVYDDVSSALEQWQSVDGQKVYIYSSGSIQAQKLLFGQSLAGDLLKYIEGHFDTAVGAKQEAASYSAIVEKIGCKADDILFLTDIVKEAEAARSAGLHVVLVSREGNAPLPSEATDNFTVIHSLGQLSSNKRKTDPQEEQPAKVPKTDNSNDVKTAIETEITKPETPEEKESEPEKMEVEEVEPPVKQTTTGEPNKPNDDEKIDTEIPEVIVEEITDSKDSDIPVIDVEPVVIECEETKADKQETEKMETEITEKVETTKVDPDEKKVDSEKIETEKPQSEKSEPEKPVEITSVSDNKDGDKKTETDETPTVPKEKIEVNEVKEKAPIAEETPPAIITEIEEITDKENIIEMADIIEDLEPVVEEPNGIEDMELQNVGDVLEKECDEILSKVQDVTNLDNIPLKSSLHPIAEETMETDNLDSNDIMERILDSEMELETKQSENNLKTATEAVEDAKKDTVVENTNKVAENTGEVAENTEKVDENTDKVAENTDKIAEEVAENTEKPLEEKPDVEEKTNSAETKEDNNVTSATKVNSVSEVKETECKEIEIPPEETTKSKQECPQEEKCKPATVNNKEEETKVEEKKETASDLKTEEVSQIDTKGNDKVTEDQKPQESATQESQVNGDTTNGAKESVNQNGDATNDEELSSRLSVDNSNDKEVNGSNGDSVDAQSGAEKKVEADAADIKVKTVTTDEPHSEPIEQPTEA